MAAASDPMHRRWRHLGIDGRNRRAGYGRFLEADGTPSHQCRTPHQVKYPLSGSTPTRDVTHAPNTAEGYTDIDNPGR